jgi:hypothetical protein
MERADLSRFVSNRNGPTESAYPTMVMAWTLRSRPDHVVNRSRTQVNIASKARLARGPQIAQNLRMRRCRVVIHPIPSRAVYPLGLYCATAK